MRSGRSSEAFGQGWLCDGLGVRSRRCCAWRRRSRWPPRSSTCSRAKQPRERGELSDVEKTAIAAFTSGTISRESPVRVAFHEALATPDQVGAPLEKSPFRFEPRLKGIAVWAAPDRIEFRPAERLPDGQAYSASLDLTALFPRGKAPLPRFDFAFGAMRQSFDVAIEGLQAADATDVKRQLLTGRLVTADVEAASRVEQVLPASHSGRELQLAWAHDPGRRIHAFSVSGIAREEEASTLTPALGRQPDRRRSEGAAARFAVAGLDSFGVQQARVVIAPEPHVELRFTDPLQPGQNLKGLVRIGDRDDLRFVIDGSRVEIYGTQGWRGEQTLRVEAGVRNVLGYRMKQARELALVFEQLKPAVRFVGKGVIVPTSAGFTVPIEAVNLRAVTDRSAADRELQHAAVPAGQQPGRRAGAAAGGPRGLEEDAAARAHARQGEPLAEAGPRHRSRCSRRARAGCTGSRSRSGGRTSRGRARAKRRRPRRSARPRARTRSSSRATGTAGPRTRPATGTSATRTATTPATPPTTSASTTTTSAPPATCWCPTSGSWPRSATTTACWCTSTTCAAPSPIPGAEVTLLDYQQQTLASARTDRDGIARLAVTRPAFLASVRHGGQTGYLRLDAGSALPVAHFDVAGTRSPKGLKGFLYGERGIWRPGDSMHLTFVLHDADEAPGRRSPGAARAARPARPAGAERDPHRARRDGFYAFERGRRRPTRPPATTTRA